MTTRDVRGDEVRIGVVSTSSWIDGRVNDQLDGYNERRSSVVRTLLRSHAVVVVNLTRDTRDEPVTWAGGADVVPVPTSFPAGSRLDRAARLVRRVMGPYGASAWEREVCDRLAEFGCDAVLVMTCRKLDVARIVSRRFPTVLFAEERVPEGTDGWGAASPLLDRVESAALRRALAHVARIVVIAPREASWAERELARPTIVIPHSVDADYWRTASHDVPAAAPSPMSEHDVLVIGNFSASRNAEGLRAVADEIAKRPAAGRPRIVLASASPRHEALADVPEEVLRWVGALDDPRPYYRAARATLVPSVAVTGAKTTVLQGWAVGCPVVATAEAAASVAGVHGEDLLVGRTPEEVVDRIYDVFRDAGLRAELRRNGRASFDSRHSPKVVAHAVDALMAGCPW